MAGRYHGDCAGPGVARTRPTDEEADQLALGGALRELRQRAKLTQEELAERIGIDVTYVSQVERGRRGVRWATVLRFLRGLNASLTELAGVLEQDTPDGRG